MPKAASNPKDASGAALERTRGNSTTIDEGSDLGDGHLVDAPLERTQARFDRYSNAGFGSSGAGSGTRRSVAQWQTRAQRTPTARSVT